MIGERRIEARTLASIPLEQVKWLDPGRIAYGKLGIIEGHPGTGKSTLTMGLAADVTKGRSPLGGTHPIEASDVVILTAEDGLGDTVRPRVLAADGDDCRIWVFDIYMECANGEELEESFSLGDHLPELESMILRSGARLVIIDPLNAFLTSAINTYKDQDVRRALMPVAKLAERTGCAIVVVRHLTKSSGGNAITAGGGSMGIIGAARTALLVAPDPDDQTKGILAVVKCNLAAKPPSLSFQLMTTPDGCSRVEWRGESPHTADGLIAASRDTGEGKGALDEAVDFLRNVLESGPIAKQEISRLRKEQDISGSTLDRAADRLGVVRAKEKRFQGVTKWALPHHSHLLGEIGSPPGANSFNGNTPANSPGRVMSLGKRVPLTPDEELAFVAEQDRLFPARKPAA